LDVVFVALLDVVFVALLDVVFVALLDVVFVALLDVLGKWEVGHTQYVTSQLLHVRF
jgi:hypothetical protein